jgi:tetratricopeptide (TPR) repeat protein
VDRLSPDDGRALLRKQGVTGTDQTLDAAVKVWDGHALTLTLLSAYLHDRSGGEVRHIDDIPAPTADEPRYQRIQRVLRQYDEHLSAAERAFLMLFSAFRTPVSEGTFLKIFRRDAGPNGLNTLLVRLEETTFAKLVERMVNRRLLRVDASRAVKFYTSHPLVRRHYAERLREHNPDQIRTIHRFIADFYYASTPSDLKRLFLAVEYQKEILPSDQIHIRRVPFSSPYTSTLEALSARIEVVHHRCIAGEYDKAFFFMREDLDRGDFLLRLGASDTVLSLTRDFFPNGDLSQEPLVSGDEVQGFLLNRVGVCLANLGRLAEATGFYERSIVRVLAKEDWHNASIDYRNLTAIYLDQGALGHAADSAHKALTLSCRVKNQDDECKSLAWVAWVAHLCDRLDNASTFFSDIEAFIGQILSQ